MSLQDVADYALKLTNQAFPGKPTHQEDTPKPKRRRSRDPQTGELRYKRRRKRKAPQERPADFWATLTSKYTKKRYD